MKLAKRMQALLDRRKSNQSLRFIKNNHHLIDFSSNDYLSLAKSLELQKRIQQKTAQLPLGSTGSRLLTGHYDLLEELEAKIAYFHQGETALIFNSGYVANLGILSTIPRRSDIILYDELVHASIHDGIRLSPATSEMFPHNNRFVLEQLLQKHSKKTVFVVIESIYSMDGDVAPLETLTLLCKQYNAHLIVDEAHSTGIYGTKGEGLSVELGVENDIFARIYTFGKAIGNHGAAVVGSKLLKKYLLNYARPLIYTTALSPHTIHGVLEAYSLLEQKGEIYLRELKERIQYFRTQIPKTTTANYINSTSPIQCLLIPSNTAVINLSNRLQKEGYDIRAIRSPTVPTGKERIRICLHRHNSMEEIKQLATFIQL